ncbi:MAG: TetR/AcrR family transcriptional regulator, partial [Actinomycetota bacterium]|nr:TetR/AcrR family transcriptional regulator [Actinomycetota bacterium]
MPSSTTPISAAAAPRTRQRIPASERRNALIEAAVHEFARGGLHGTPVERVARRVGVAQPYVFSLFSSKRELFLAALERCFTRVGEVFDSAAAQFGAAGGP